MSIDATDPIELFVRWQEDAAARFGVGESKFARLRNATVAPVRWALRPLFGELPHADAAALATATKDGVPSVRMVLVKQSTADAFVFYTNLGSRKAAEIEDNPMAELAFHWPFPPRQVRVAGSVERQDAAADDAYWQTRPRGSQLGAMASRQSRTISGRTVLEERLAKLEARHADERIPCPDYWGGYRLVPDTIEFWQGRPDRLHDRRRYVRDADAETGWRTETVAPWEADQN